MPRLTTTGDEPIVVHRDEEGAIVVDPGPVTGPQGSFDVPITSLLDVGYDAGMIRLLGWNDDGLGLWSIANDASVSYELVADTTSTGHLVAGSSPPWVAVPDGSSVSLYEDGAFERVYGAEFAQPPTLSAVALDGRALLANRAMDIRGFDGTAAVWDSGFTRTFGAFRSLSCPPSYTAEYPDLCEYEFVPDVTTPGAVIAATLVVNAGVPWLVSVVGDVTDTCRTMTGRCFETLPCDCGYLRSGSLVRTELRLDSLDGDSRSLRIPLNDVRYEAVWLSASATPSNAIAVAVAVAEYTPSGSSAATAVDYLMITP
jgi:hypothetical protein